jgi:hypothetical protein
VVLEPDEDDSPDDELALVDVECRPVVLLEMNVEPKDPEVVEDDVELEEAVGDVDD